LEEAKQHILDRLSAGEAGDYESLLEDLLSRLPDQRTPSLYLTQMITAITLVLHSLKRETDVSGMSKTLRNVGLPGELDLNVLSGLTLGLSLIDLFNRRVSNLLLVHAKKYQEILSEVHVENRRSLAEFTREIVDIVGI
jgi:hypothetical protein